MINTHQGLYKYKRLPFGLSCAPAVFQKLIEQMVSHIPGVACYLDDIVVTGKDEQQYLINLQKTMECLKATGLCWIKLEKCQFLLTVSLLDEQGVCPHPDKIKAITAMPEPKSQSELHSFLGIVTYYDHFVPGLATKCAPLNNLLQKNVKWNWTSEHTEAVQSVKSLY